MKKGFTIIEMLGVFAILALILLISIPSLIGLLKKQKEDSYQKFLNDLYLATEAYSQTSDRYDFSMKNQSIYIKIEEIIKEKYLKSTLINPKTNESVNVEHYIEVKVKGDGKIEYTYVEEAP